jgi:oxaloacetate decarboxylase alpha subunit
MQIETIDALAGILAESSLSLLEVEGGDWSLRMERPATVSPASGLPVEAGTGPAVQNAVAPPDVTRIEASMVGVFHESAPIVAVGQEVRAGDILGAIEALALRNEVRSPVDGPVVGVAVEDGQPVEYGQLLFTLGRSGPNE